MKNFVRALFEKIAYAGLKPSVPGSSGSHLDPLYLSKRSSAQKALTGAAIALPFVLIVTGTYLAATGYFSTPTAPPPPSREEISAKVLPSLKDTRVEATQLISVMDAHFTRGKEVSLDGTLKNNVTRLLRSVEVDFNLTNEAGALVGIATARIDQLESEAITTFHVPVKQRDAVRASFREARSQ